MILIGSYALAVLGFRSLASVNDIDIVGTSQDIEHIRQALGNRIVSERPEFDHRHVFYLKGDGINRIELDFEQSPSDCMLPALCNQTVTIFGMKLAIPTVEALYLIKRAHANVPVHFDKCVSGMLELKPLIGELSEAHMKFYRARKDECGNRYQLHRQRFALAIRNEDFFDTSNHIRFYEHDDLHRAVAHIPGQPLFERCKHDLTLAKIDIDLFEKLSPVDRLRMVQEEFMVIGLERYYLRDRSFNSAECYAYGMSKTIRDLFVGYFQDFCLDNLDLLQTPPPYDFVARFNEAVTRGEVREVAVVVEEPTPQHKSIWALIGNGELGKARQLAEDMVRVAVGGMDPHALFLLGVVLSKTGEHRHALSCLINAISRDRKNAFAWLHIGISMAATGRNDQAVKALKQTFALGLRPNELYWHLGQALEAESNPREAAAAYLRLYRKDPSWPGLTDRLKELDEGFLQAS